MTFIIRVYSHQLFHNNLIITNKNYLMKLNTIKILENKENMNLEKRKL
jgi:hypothetical protein